MQEEKLGEKPEEKNTWQIVGKDQHDITYM